MRRPRLQVLLLPVLVLLLPTWGLSQEPRPAKAIVQSAPEEVNVHPEPVSSFDELVGRIAEREHYFNQQIEKYHPLIETYIQNLKDNDELGPQPVSDQYFLGRLDVSGDLEDRFASREKHSFFAKLNILPKLRDLYAMHFLPEGFAQMVLVDPDFGRAYYKFSYVRKEFLGEVRCLVIDVQPKKDAGDGRFVGRIWVEDQDYNIVRFNGTYTSRHHYNSYLHFDSWRLNMRPGLWLPAYIYSEESGDRVRMGQTLHFKAQTRLWGYDLPRMGSDSSFTAITVDSPQTVRDQSQAQQDASPVESQRLWEREAEDNALERLRAAGLIAPDGEVDQVMQTVVNNLIFTNNLDIQPGVRCRVLLTTPLESFTIGHTIVLSRGLLDVLPDEASLAMVLAHELGHIVLGHQVNTEFAFNDRMFFSDEQTFQQMDFAQDPAAEEAADNKALQLLANSPYKNKLANAGLFLRSLHAHASELKHLIRPHLGSSFFEGGEIRMSALLNSAPALEVKRMDQIAALPLGGRIKLDPWSSRIELIKGKPVALANSREKMPFEVTPFFPYLSRLSSASPEKVALTAPTK
jgi:Peptidase family M48